jgi:hypothetical protein
VRGEPQPNSRDNILPLQLQSDSGSSCNRYTLRVATIECFRPILYYPFSCNRTIVWVAIYVHSELQILSAPAVLPDNTLPVQLQLDSGSSCNRCTLWVTNTKCFRLIQYYPFSCNRIVVRVAIEVHSELQILGFQWFHLVSGLQLEDPNNCNLVVVFVAMGCKPQPNSRDNILPLQLQSDSGSSCNQYTLRVANIECFRLILYPTCIPNMLFYSS